MGSEMCIRDRLSKAYKKLIRQKQYHANKLSELEEERDNCNLIKIYYLKSEDKIEEVNRDNLNEVVQSMSGELTNIALKLMKLGE